MITKGTIDDVLSRADIVQEIGARVELRKAGVNYIGLCPFHGEKSASFSVSPSKQFFHCFGCGAHGDVLGFLQQHDGMEFHEAVRYLADSLGVPVVEEDSKDGKRHASRTPEQKTRTQRQYETLAKAAAFYAEQMRQQKGSGGPAAAYAEMRGIPEDRIRDYAIGYAPQSNDGLRQIFADYDTSQDLVDVGLIVELGEENGPRCGQRYDRFRDRLIFPIRDTSGKVIGFGGRVINADRPKAPKYLNSPETELFLKHKVIYGLHEARSAISRAKSAFVSEGYMDVVAMASHDIGNAVAVMGTALTEDHLRLLGRFTKRMCFVFDGDNAGQKAAWKTCVTALPVLAPDQHLTFLTLPDGLDPDEFLKANGKDVFLALADAAPTLSKYLLDELQRKIGRNGVLDSIESRVQYTQEARALIDLLPPKTPMRKLLLDEVSLRTGNRPVSAADRLRSQNGNRPWLSPEEYRAQRDKGQVPAKNSEFHRHPSSPDPVPTSIWEKLGNACKKAPRKAYEIAPNISPMLDTTNADEAALLAILDGIENGDGNFPDPSPSEMAAHQLAGDLLDRAHEIIRKHRESEVLAELARMHASGELSEGEYIQQAMLLRG